MAAAGPSNCPGDLCYNATTRTKFWGFTVALFGADTALSGRFVFGVHVCFCVLMPLRVHMPLADRLVFGAYVFICMCLYASEMIDDGNMMIGIVSNHMIIMASYDSNNFNPYKVHWALASK